MRTGQVSSPMVLYSLEVHGGTTPKILCLLDNVGPWALYHLVIVSVDTAAAGVYLHHEQVPGVGQQIHAARVACDRGCQMVKWGARGQPEARVDRVSEEEDRGRQHQEYWHQPEKRLWVESQEDQPEPVLGEAVGEMESQGDWVEVEVGKTLEQGVSSGESGGIQEKLLVERQYPRRQSTVTVVADVEEEGMVSKDWGHGPGESEQQKPRKDQSTESGPGTSQEKPFGRDGSPQEAEYYGEPGKAPRRDNFSQEAEYCSVPGKAPG